MYVYHFVPTDMDGTVLIPLNQLKTLKPELYAQHKTKYAGLKEQDVEMPNFGLWNDCINLMPVNPGLVKEELEKYGHDTNWEWKFYKIPVEILDKSKLIFMVPQDKDDASQRAFEQFSEEAFEKYSKSLDIARHRYQRAKERNEQPYTFGGIPHLLYKGVIDTKNLEIISFG